MGILWIGHGRKGNLALVTFEDIWPIVIVEMIDGDAVIVAVRVRPFSERERYRNAECIIEMSDDGKSTTIKDPNNNDTSKSFTFDHSYWSHDGFEIEHNGYLRAISKKYADQKRIFDNLGQGVVDNAWKGYNCCLFAYGQTGSGKSYSIVGFRENKGIVPLVCEELFERIEHLKVKGDGFQQPQEFQVSISMMEIYCEKVRDLLNPKHNRKGGLKVRENPKTGFYVEGLSSYLVSSYKEIEQKVNEGTRVRTIAATNMNETSSRAHTIVKIQFNQRTPKSGGGSIIKSSEINLVDLAGSERQKSAGSEGERFKEGIIINKSLMTLGRVMKSLHEKQINKSRNIQIPYRDSVLTCLLKNALGGNSKTIMIAAISPADIHYDETLSTLRFADRAKSIKTKPIVNESATERLIRELREENARLQEMIRRGGIDSSVASFEELDNLKRQLSDNQKEVATLERTWQQRIQEEPKTKRSARNDDEIEKKRQEVPHMWNLNEDPALTDMIVWYIESGETRVGNIKGASKPHILLKGLNILPEHALLSNKDNKKVTIRPLSSAEILINGRQITQETELNQNDRIHFGGNHLYVFVNPTKKGALDSSEISYDMAQKEIAKNFSGITSQLMSGKTKEDIVLEQELINTLPNVYRANSMAKELKKNINFEVVLMPPEMRGLTEGNTEIWIKVHNKSDDTTFLWDANKFTNRYYGMQEIYQNYSENDPDWNVPKERDPFYEPADSSVVVGTVRVYLQSLAYMVELDEQFPIIDIHGAETGQLSVCLMPCNTAGKEILGEFVENPSELVKKNLAFKIKILSALGLPRRIDKSYCTYTFFERGETTTHKAEGSNPAYAHEELFTFRPVTQELVDYLKTGCLNIIVHGIQRVKDSSLHSSAASSRISNYLNQRTSSERKAAGNIAKQIPQKPTIVKPSQATNRVAEKEATQLSKIPVTNASKTQAGNRMVAQRNNATNVKTVKRNVKPSAK